MIYDLEGKQDMIDDAIRSGTKYIIEKHLAIDEPGPWTIGTVCITAHRGQGCRLPADAIARRVTVEESEVWTVALDVVLRDNKVVRFDIAGYFDDCGSLGLQGVREAYHEWLCSL
jgi:hypothetical protein